MPAKLLLPLRYLQPSFPVARFSTMKPVKTSRVLPVFYRVFPHKLKYQSFGSLNLASNGNNSKQQELKNQFCSNAIRKLSTRSGGEVRASRSLIDDEAELSDWVSGLSSKKTRLYSDSEKDDDERGSVGFGKGSGSGREERGGKRRRESGFGEFDGSSRRGGTRSSTERFPRRGENAGDTAERFPRRRDYAGDTAERFPRRRENAGDTTERFLRRRGNAGDTTERFPRRRGNAGDTTERFPRKRENAGDTTERFPRRRGNAGDNVSSRRERGFDDFNGSSRQHGAWDSVERFPGRGRGNGGGNVSSRQKGMDLNERYSGGSRGKGAFGGEMEGRREKKRGVRDSGSHFEMDRDGGRGIRRGEKGERRGSLVMSEEDDVDEEEDEDEEDKGYRSFKELIGSDEGSEEVDDDEDEDEEEDDEQGGDVFNRESVLAQRVSEDAGRGSSPDSPGSSHSYLSETR